MNLLKGLMAIVAMVSILAMGKEIQNEIEDFNYRK